MDLRGCYTALAIAHMLCLDVQRLAQHCALPHFLSRCQVRSCLARLARLLLQQN